MGAEGGKRAVDDLSLISTRSKIPKFANSTATANRLYAVLHSLLPRQHTKSHLQPVTSTGKWRWGWYWSLRLPNSQYAAWIDPVEVYGVFRLKGKFWALNRRHAVLDLHLVHVEERHERRLMAERVSWGGTRMGPKGTAESFSTGRDIPYSRCSELDGMNAY